MRKHILSLTIAIISSITLSAQNFHLNEDFNSGTVPANWNNNAVTGTQGWSFGIDGATAHAGNQNLDGTNFAYFDDDALGGGSTNNTAELVTPSFNNATDPITFLEFDYNFREFGGANPPDSFTVDVFDGISWNRVFSKSLDDCGNYIQGGCAGNFPHAKIDISAFANVNCQVRFIYHDGNDWGWYVGLDNVEIYSPFANDIGVAELVDPTSGCGLTASETVSVKIINYGTAATATPFNVVYNINNGAQTLNETVTTSILGGDSLVYTFTATANFSATATYNISAYTIYAADLNNSNDTLVSQIANEPSFAPTFTDGFEGTNNWKVEGTNASWALGVPAGTVINNPSSGVNAYVTNLSGPYNNNEESYLISPCFDFSQGSGDPIVTFDLNYRTESNFDKLSLESSIDNGLTWQLVTASANPTNWYNVGQSWEGNSNGWKPTENVLTGLGGQSQVKLRFKFKTDGSGTFEGVGVDNFSVRFPQPVDVSLNELTYPSAAGTPLCGFGNENIIIELENKGANRIDTMYLSYRINNSFVSTDTLIQAFLPNTILSYTFNNKYNFSNITTYDVDVWVVAPRDGFGANDTILNSTLNNASVNIALTPFFEDFENFIPGTGFANTGSGLANGWSANPAGANFFWGARTGPTGSGGTGPDDDHTPNGSVYVYVEGSTGPNGAVATLETPCLDFTTANGGRLEFWSHRFGGSMVTLFIDVYDGVSWVNGVASLTNTPQTANNSPYTFNQVNLNAYAGRRIKVRFRTSGKTGFATDCAIDDVLIYEPIPQDAELLRIITPNDKGDACGVGANSDFTVEINNFGTAAIAANAINVYYQIDNLPPVKDTVNVPLAVGATTNFTFSQGPNLSTIGQNYQIKAWTELNGDSNVGNDSILNYSVTNFTRQAGYIESFESFSFIDGDCASSDGDIIGNGWSVNTDEFTWNLQNANFCAGANGATNSLNTGPAGDHTTGNGKFFYTEADFSDVSEATLTSPCIDFTQASGATVAFWYHKYGAQMGNLFVDVRVNGNQWISGVDVISGQTQTGINDAWLLKGVNLSTIAPGNLIQVRFRGSRGTGTLGDMAIDDIEFFEPIPQDARVSRIINPITECSPAGTVTIEVENFGSQNITGDIPVGFNIDGGGAVLDTIPGPLAVAGKTTFTFPITANFAKPSTIYEIKAWTSLLNDSNVFNDTLVKSIENLTKEISYVENFESFTDGGGCGFAYAGDVLRNGWEANPSSSSNQYHWNVHDAGACGSTSSGGTGAATDHTKGNGIYMYTESSQGGTIQPTLTSPCIDFTGKTGAAMNFWYHRFGNSMGGLSVDVFANNVWNNGVFTLTGQQQTSENDPWELASAKFNQFAGQEIRVRFRATSGASQFSSDMGVDDISFFAPLARDARTLAVTGPVSGCEINDASTISIDVENFGTLPIQADSMFVYYQVDKRTPVKDTVETTLAPDQTLNFTFTVPADLSQRGRKYNIKAWTELIGEQDVDNDTLFRYTVINETKITNYFESFESFRDSKCDEQLGQVLENGWFAVPSTSTHNWQLQSSLCGKNDLVTPTASTGPNGDHTNGKGNFMFTEGDGTGTAILQSPCIDLNGNVNPRLSFFYHRFGTNMGIFTVDVFSNGSWTNGLTTITGQTQSSASAQWSQRIVDLSPYVGQLIQVRFRSNKTSGGNRGDMAIDDLYLYEASNLDAGVQEITSPNSDGCGLVMTNVTARIRNFGLQTIAPGQLFVEYNDNNGPFTRDTIQQSIAPGSSILYTFNDNVDLSGAGKHIIKVRTVLAGDTLVKNDISTREVTNRQPGFPRYFMDFEKHVQSSNPNSYNGDNLRGFQRSPANGGPGTYMWHVWSGTAPYVDGQPPIPPGPPTGPSGDHTFATNLFNGKGTYMLVESDLKQLEAPNRPFVAPATLKLPCGPIDLTASVNGKPFLSFWYHMYGAETGDLSIEIRDVAPGSVNGTYAPMAVIRGAQQQDDTDRWRRFQIDMSQYASYTQAEIQFKAITASHADPASTHYPGKGRGGDIAIDDIEIIDRIARDAAVIRLIDPDPNCDLSATEDFQITVQNLGTTDILKLRMCYQIRYTAKDSSFIDFPVVCDSIVGQTIVPTATYNYKFPRIDMSAPGSYTFKVWTDYSGDTYAFNDTLIETVNHYTRKFPSCEDFSDMLYDWKAKDFKDNTLPNNYIGNPGAYTFKASIEGTPDVPGLKGHTSGLNDIFLLAFDGDGMPGQEARISTPCFDLTNTPAANLEFYYIAPAASHNLLIQARAAGGAWVDVDTIFGDPKFTWTKRTVVLTDFVGDFVEIQFTGLNTGGGYYAIDDVCLVRPKPQQIAFQEFVTPQPNLCFYSDSEYVRVRLRNIGIDNIDAFQVVVAVDKTIQSFPLGNLFRDTITVFPGANPPFFEPGDRLDVLLDLPSWAIDMSMRTDYFLHAWILLPGDKDFSDNFKIDYKITHPVPVDLPYIVDFEGSVESTGLTFFGPSAMGYNWYNLDNNGQFKSGMDQFGLTGPAYDHTFGNVLNTPGRYAVTQAAGGALGEAIAVQTRCIDLSKAQSPEIRYWYHMFGFQMGNLELQVNDDSGWQTIDILQGQDPDQFTNFKDWKSRTIKLDAYKGKFVRFRFISYRGNGAASNMALDDIAVYDLAAKDLTPVSLDEPTGDSSSCYSATQQVVVNLRNNGSDSINFEVDTTHIDVVIYKDNQGDGNFVFEDSLKRTVIRNEWVHPVIGDTFALPRDSVVPITMDGTFDMSDTGSFYKFFVFIDMVSDKIVTNDAYDVTVKSQRKTGQIVSIVPNDTVCYGTQVTMTVKNHFGALRWERNLHKSSGPGNWFPGFNFPFDSAYYTDAADSTADYRARVCPQLFTSENIDETTDSVNIEVIKPWTPKGIDDSRCGNVDEVLNLGAEVASNISLVRLYESLTGGIPLDSDLTRFSDPATGYAFQFDRDTTQIDSTQTFYLESIILNDNVEGGRCVSLNRNPVTAYVNSFPKPGFTSDPEPVCQDTSILLDAGQLAGRQDVYQWTVYMPDGRIVTDSLTTQTIVVDAYLLELNATYGYEVLVRTDSGCRSTPFRKDITITDSCITSIAEINFKKGFEIYPNPVSDELNIIHQSLENFRGDIKLMTTKGRLIEFFEDVEFGNLTKRIEMGMLPKGVYIIKVDTEKGSFVQKIIKS